ncbi:MAG: dethiobiotin synthase [Planctomycetes bacterium]|nr:dethiobiotin synthase [Planctomycetota bacterium]
MGKTWVTGALVRGLRGLGRRCWVHKPVACGGWDGATSEDGRTLALLAGDGQDPASICPRQYPEPSSPHLAAALAGDRPCLADLVAAARAVRGPADLVLETAGGLLSPLTAARETVADLVQALAMPTLLVSVPDLGTLSHTALTVAEARRRGIAVLGLVVVHVRPTVASVAVATAARELAEICALPVLAEIAHTTGMFSDDAVSRALAGAVLARGHYAGRA